MQKYAPAFVLLFLFGCKDLGVNIPPAIPINELLASPDSVFVEGKHLSLSTYLWRSFMPQVPTTNTGLIAIVYVAATDSSQVPNSITVDAIWIVYRGQVWSSFLEPAPQQTDRAIAKVCRNGPEWDGPVDVIVRILDSSGNAHLLRVSQQQVGRVD